MKKNIFEKLRSDKGARAIAVTIVLMLLVLIARCAVVHRREIK